MDRLEKQDVDLDRLFCHLYNDRHISDRPRCRRNQKSRVLREAPNKAQWGYLAQQDRSFGVLCFRNLGLQDRRSFGLGYLDHFGMDRWCFLLDQAQERRWFLEPTDEEIESGEMEEVMREAQVRRVDDSIDVQY